jgi:hypothetical protein
VDADCRYWLMLSAVSATQALAESCVVHSQAERLDVKVCQENRNIPEKLFADGFCKPNWPGRRSKCNLRRTVPDAGAFGQCSNAQVANMPYRQNIHYYGVATDAAYLQPFCEAAKPGHLAGSLEAQRRVRRLAVPITKRIRQQSPALDAHSHFRIVSRQSSSSAVSCSKSMFWPMNTSSWRQSPVSALQFCMMPGGAFFVLRPLRLRHETPPAPSETVTHQTTRLGPATGVHVFARQPEETL